MNILIAPNSFKECADSVEISNIISKTLVVQQSLKMITKPLSDGGDGFLSVIKSFLDAVEVNIVVKDEFGQPKNYKILIDKKTETGYLESASVIGLKSMEEKDRKPLQLNSSVIGKVINKFSADVNNLKVKIKDLVIGIGGTATIDFGIGACSQLGLSLFDKKGNNLLPTPQNFNNIASIKFIKPDLPFQIKCVVDVDTDLIGEPGSIEIYGNQKGASENDLNIIKSGIKNILNLISADKEFIVPNKLNGAGGGLAAGLNIFFSAEIVPAKNFIVDYILKDVNLDEIDAVVTGEGSFDSQSFEGKGVGVILNLFKDKSIPILLINGSTNLPSNIKLPENVFVINLIDLFKSKEESIKNFQLGIAKAIDIGINKELF